MDSARVKPRRLRTDVENLSALPMPRLLSFIFLLLSFSLGCITPPPMQPPSVVPEPELEVISLIRRGKDYSAGGRADLAEQQFRLALELRPGNEAIYNDIGFVLLAQGRLEESEDFFRAGLRLAPNNVVLRENLARTLYRRGEIGPAIKEYHKLLNTLLTLSSKELSRQISADFTDMEFVRIYRDLAMAYYTLGITDEAACYSHLAFVMAANIFEAGRHSRLLLSMNRIPTALEVLRNVVIARQGVVPAKIFLDYGISLYLSDDKNLAKAALSRVLQEATASRTDRRTARLLLLRLALGEERAPKEGKFLYTTLLEEDPRFCLRTNLDTDDYWPALLTEELAQLQGMLCDEENESLFTS